MKVIVHMEPNFKATHVRTLIYSVKYKKYPKWWDIYNCDYFVKEGKFLTRKGYILDFVLKQLYESMHDVPDCDDCEYNQESEDCYCETRAIILEDRD